MNIIYRATGNVWGNYWGGGQGRYTANAIDANSKEELDKKINQALQDGSLDGGMGYESLIGAVMFIDTIDTRIIDDKSFVNVDTSTEVYGDLPEEIIELLLNS